MGLMFRKTKKFGPLNLTMSSGGIGYSVGGMGMRVGRGADGRSRFSACLPGTGVSYRSYGSSRKSTTNYDVLNKAFLYVFGIGFCMSWSVVCFIATVSFVVGS